MNSAEKNMDLAIYLKQKRRDAELSQGAVARKLGYSSPQFVSNWERGLSDPPIATLRKLALIFRVPNDEMFNTILEITIQRTTADLRVKFDGKKGE